MGIFNQTVIKVLLLIIVAGVFISLVAMFFRSGETAVSSVMPLAQCPKKVSINDYVERMQTFASEDSRTPEPEYAIRIFWEYVNCKNPRVGEPRFTQEEIEEHDAEILSCAKAAYVGYSNQVQSKIQTANQDPESVRYWTEVGENVTEQYEFFNALYPESRYSGTMCNYPATGNTAQALG